MKELIISLVAVISPMISFAQNRVGIGISTPLYPLHISNAANAPISISLSNAHTGQGIADGTQIGYLQANSNDFTLSNQENGSLTFATNQGNAVLRLAKEGRLGIGILQPVNQLHIHQPDQTITGVRISNGLTGAGSADGLFLGYGFNNSQNVDIFNYENGDLRLGTNGGYRLVIKPGGNVGIGTITPDASAALEVSSTTRGFLPPRMNRAQRDAIATPAEGLIISCIDCSQSGMQQYINGSWQAMSTNNIGNYGTVTNPVTGKTWLDRNLGASRVATSPTDEAAYGDLYQWGRNADGHQLRSSQTTNVQASQIFTSHGLFIIGSLNWLAGATPPTDMWSGTAGQNNPCPSGFRIPTAAEWQQEMLTWNSNDAASAFASPLKLTLGGVRSLNNGNFVNADIQAVYWSSTPHFFNNASYSFMIDQTSAGIHVTNSSWGLSVRCIKD